jgi:hypothetical protein
MPAAGDTILASDINAVIARLPVTTTKAAATARNTTTTLADDPHLSGITLTPGTYDIELVFFYTLTTTTTQKIKTRWAFTTGTWSTTNRACHGPGSDNVDPPESVAEATFRVYTTDGQDAVYDSSTSAAYSAVREVARGVVVTVTGTLSLQWAQVASSANNTTVQAGSSFTTFKTA